MEAARQRARMERYREGYQAILVVLVGVAPAEIAEQPPFGRVPAGDVHRSHAGQHRPDPSGTDFGESLPQAKSRYAYARRTQ